MVDIDTGADISLEALQSGDRAEFARLVDAYSTQIYRLALKMLGDEQDAEDVLQNTFMKALQSIGKFRRPFQPVDLVIPHCCQRSLDAVATPEAYDPGGDGIRRR